MLGRIRVGTPALAPTRTSNERDSQTTIRCRAPHRFPKAPTAHNAPGPPRMKRTASSTRRSTRAAGHQIPHALSRGRSAPSFVPERDPASRPSPVRSREHDRAPSVPHQNTPAHRLAIAAPNDQGKERTRFHRHRAFARCRSHAAWRKRSSRAAPKHRQASMRNWGRAQPPPPRRKRSSGARRHYALEGHGSQSPPTGEEIRSSRKRFRSPDAPRRRLEPQRRFEDRARRHCTPRTTRF